MTLRLAHRGDWRVAPENSLVALVAGARAPRSDGVEFDVRIAADGVAVVIHDADLSRVQGVPHEVLALGSEALGKHGVPTLAEVLAALPAKALLDVELKVVPDRALAEVLLAARGPAPARAVVSAFDPDALRVAGELLPGWRRWLNTPWLDEDVVTEALRLRCAGIAAEWRAITPATARSVHAAGLELAAWTVRRRPTVERLARLGVVAVCVEGAPLDR